MNGQQNLHSFKELLKLSGISHDILSDLPEEFQNIELTYAEKILIYEGTKIGLANCFIPKRKYLNKEQRIFTIRAEILEWLFSPSRAEKIFKKGKIRIIGAHIDRQFELKNLSDLNIFPIERKYKDSYSLYLAYTSIKIDVIFEKCTFYGGINLTNSSTKDFVLTACRIGYTIQENFWGKFKNSIKADNINTNGDLKITDYHEEETESSLYNSWLRSGDQNDKTIITNDLFLQGAKINELLSFNSLEVNGNLNLKEIESKELYLYNCTIHGSVNLDMSHIKSVMWADAGKFLGGGDYYNNNLEQKYSISAVGSIIGWIAIRENAEIINGINLAAIKTNLAIFYSSFISKNFQTGIAINLARAEIATDLYLSKGMLISGRIDLYDSKIGRNLELFQSKFIGSIDPNKKALACDNISVGSKISFSKIKNSSKTILNELKENPTEAFETIYPSTFEKKKERFIRQSLKNRRDLFEQFKQKKSMVENGKLTEEGLREWYLQICDSIKNYEESVYFKPLKDLETSYNIITNEINKENIFNEEEELKSELIETSLVIGEASFSGIRLNGQFDCSNCAFIGMDPSQEIYMPKSREITWKIKFFKLLRINIPRETSDDLNNFPNALTIKYAKIEGDLFLNEGSDESPIPFRALGEVNLHSSKINQFFVSPLRGEHDYTKWKLIGLKYDYIYSKNIKLKNLKNRPLHECDWFYDYNEENNRQPYEQLATVYLKYGEDKIARDILLNSYPKNIPEGIMLSLLYYFSRIGIPHYTALRNIIILVLLGWLVYYRAALTEGFVATSKIGCLNIVEIQTNQVLFSPFFYSLQTTIPLISSEQKSLFTPKFHSGKNFLLENRFIYIDSGRIATLWLSISTFFGIILISMFIISITKIIRRN